MLTASVSVVELYSQNVRLSTDTHPRYRYAYTDFHAIGFGNGFYCANKRHASDAGRTTVRQKAILFVKDAENESLSIFVRVSRYLLRQSHRRFLDFASMCLSAVIFFYSFSNRRHYVVVCIHGGD